MGGFVKAALVAIIAGFLAAVGFYLFHRYVEPAGPATRVAPEANKP